MTPTALNARSVAQMVKPLAPAQPSLHALERFSADENLFAIPVVDQGKPLGLIGRHDFLLTFAGPFGRDLYSGRPVTALMDTQPLVVEADDVLESVGARIVQDKPGALLRGVIVVEEGRYLGIATGLAVLGATLTSLEERRDQLDAANRAAIAANQAKSSFLASMSHELRSPLNAVIGFADIIEAQSFGPDAMARYREYAGFIASSGRHLLDLINDILDISKIESGRMELEFYGRNLASELAETIRTCAAQAEQENIRLEAEIPSTSIPAFADGRALRQITLNLASNAVKYSRRGGTVRITLEPPDAEGMSAIVVEDFGLGIPAAMLERVWQPFERVDNSYSASARGTGLGLALVRRLTELQRGTIVMESAPEHGTKVTIRLPSSIEIYHARADGEAAVLTLIADRPAPARSQAIRKERIARTFDTADIEAILHNWTSHTEWEGNLPPAGEILERIDPALERWMTLFEPCGDGDFRVVREGAEVVAFTQEDWTGRLASEIDREFTSDLQTKLALVFAQRQPRLDLRMGLFQSKGITANRMLLPVRDKAGETRVMSLLLPAPDRRT